MEILTTMPKNSKIRLSVEEWLSQFEGTSNEAEREIIIDGILSEIKESKELDPSDKEVINMRFCSIFEYYSLSSYNDACKLQWDIQHIDSSSSIWWNSWEQGGGLPTWLKIVLFILVWWLLVMWGIIVFFSIKAKLNNSEEDEW